MEYNPAMADLRYRNARDEADRLGQVFTPQAIAELLAQSIAFEHDHAFHILDLGAGHGALADAILKKYKRSSATLVEVDVEHVETLRRVTSKRATVLQADVLSDQWISAPPPAVIVSNPPYGNLLATNALAQSIAECGLPVPFNGKWVRGDAAFVARAWAISSHGTKLGLIVASPMIRNMNYRPMRERLVQGLRGLCVTQLPNLTFKNAEVSAYLLTGQRAIRRPRKVLLRKASTDGSVLEEIEVRQEDASVSLDIDYHLLLRRLGLEGKVITETLGSVGTVINRGSRTQQEFKQMGLSAFHTTDFPKGTGEVVLSGQRYENYHVARPGDILIPRVGSRCLVRQARVQGGSGHFTDCVYRLSVPGHAQSRVWKSINSSFGAEWRVANADGSCAKHLRLDALLGMPLVP